MVEFLEENIVKKVNLDFNNPKIIEDLKNRFSLIFILNDGLASDYKNNIINNDSTLDEIIKSDIKFLNENFLYDIKIDDKYLYSHYNLSYYKLNEDLLLEGLVIFYLENKYKNKIENRCLNLKINDFTFYTDEFSIYDLKHK